MAGALGPRLTIAICTLAPSADLSRCMESLQQQRSNAGTFEVLVVDNGPSRATADFVDAYRNSPLRVRYAEEPRRGLTYARRRAWKSAIGEFVAYLDDDAVAHPSWASSVIQAFDCGDPAVAMVGGPVHNVKAIRQPWTFTSAPGASGLDLGPNLRPLTPSENLWGGNCALRRSVLHALNGFGEPLGHRGGRPGANEDIIIQRQLDRSGFTRLYSPEVQILHSSWRDIASSRELDSLAFFTGVDDAVMDRLLGTNSIGARCSAIGARIRRLGKESATGYRARRNDDLEGALAARRAALRSLGLIFGYAWPPNSPTEKPRE